jgi:hypothetical protein
MHIGSLLSWTQAADIESALRIARQRHLSRMAEQLSFVFAGLEGRPHQARRIEQIRAHFNALTESSLLHILEAPETHFQLTRPIGDGASLAAFLEQAIEAEELRCGLRASAAAPLWSASGDAYFTGVAGDGAPNLDGPASWDRARPYRAPRLAGETVVDLYSPYVYLNLDDPETGGASPRFAHDDAHAPGKFLVRLNGAANAILSSCAPAHMFATRSIRVLAIARDADRGTSYRSISSRAHIGKATLVNPHLPNVTAARIADSLIHEAVHSFLYEREQKKRWIIDLEQTTDARIASPWTGKPLRLDSYLHACFVWYALARFWSLPEASKALPSDQVQYLAGRALGGFQDGRMLAPVLQAHRNISDGVVDEIKWLQEQIQA